MVCCVDLDLDVSSNPKWLGTRSPISLNFPVSIFSTRLGETGGIAKPKIAGGWLVGREDILCLDGRLTCFKSKKVQGKVTTERD